MNKKLNLVDRFLSETPDFWKVIGLIGFLVAAAAGFLADNGFQSKWITIAGAIGAALALVSKFAKKDVQLLESTTDDLEGLSKLLPEFKDQAQAVVKTLKPAMNAFKDSDKPD